ncbi:hypothetical protein LguiA_012951 [Lonicera macranthoides]
MLDNGLLSLPVGSRKWRSPPASWIKMNFDGACFKEEGAVGLGAIAKNSDESFLVGQFLMLGANLNAETSEAMATLEALRLARQLGYSQVIIEGDSRNIIYALEHGGSQLSTIGNIMLEARSIVAGLPDVKFFWVTREGSYVAHLLARQARVLGSSTVWFNVAPRFIEDTISCDGVPASKGRKSQGTKEDQLGWDHPQILEESEGEFSDRANAKSKSVESGGMFEKNECDFDIPVGVSPKRSDSGLFYSRDGVTSKFAPKGLVVNHLKESDLVRGSTQRPSEFNFRDNSFSFTWKIPEKHDKDQSFTIRSLDKTRNVKSLNANHEYKGSKDYMKSFKKKASNEDQSRETNQSIRRLVNSVIEIRLIDLGDPPDLTRELTVKDGASIATKEIFNTPINSTILNAYVLVSMPITTFS